MDKKQRAQNPSKSCVTPDQAKKLDELADKIGTLPERRRRLIEGLMQKKLLDSKEVCEILNVSYPTVRRWIARNDVKFVKVGRFIRFPREEILRLVENQQALTVAEVADILGVGALTVRHMIKRGELKAFRTSEVGHYRVLHGDLERLLTGG